MLDCCVIVFVTFVFLLRFRFSFFFFLQFSHDLRYHIPIIFILGINKSLIHRIQVDQNYTYPCEQIRFDGGHKIDIGSIVNVVVSLKELQSSNSATLALLHFCNHINSWPNSVAIFITDKGQYLQ